MATVTRLVTTPDSSNTPNATGSFTPNQDDLLVVVVVTSASVTDADDVPTASANGITFSPASAGTAVHGQYNTDANSIDIFVADQLVGASPAAMTINWGPTDAGTSSITDVYAVRAAGGRAGTQAVVQVDQTNNGAAAGTPSIVFPGNVNTNNVTIVAVGNLSAPAGVTEPSGWTEVNDSNATTPTAGIEVAARTSGFTGTTVTWGGASATAWGAIGVEINTAASTNAQAGQAAGTGTAYNATVKVAPTPGQAAGTGTAYNASVPRTSPGLELSSFGTFSGVGSGDTINYVRVSIVHKETAGADAPTYQLWDGASSQIGTTQTGTTGTTDHTDTHDFTGVTYAQLATLRVRLYGHSVAGLTESVDSVSLTVNYTAAGHNADAGQASGTGTAYNTTSQVSPGAGQAAGTGTAYTTTSQVKPGPSLATAAGTGYDATVSISGANTTNAQAGQADGTGTANNTTALVNPGAGQASGTGTGNNAAANVQPRPVTATGTGTAFFDASGGSISLDLIQDTPIIAVGTAYNATVQTGSFTNAQAGQAAGTGTAYAPSASVKASAGQASGTGTANNTTSQVSPTPGQAAGTGTANNTTSQVKPVPALATGSGVANNATVQTGSFTNAQAGQAAGTGTANNTTTTVKPVPGTATGIGTANQPNPLVKPTAGLASATGAANNASVTTTPTTLAQAGQAAGTGTAYAPVTRVATGSGQATGTGTAFNATVRIFVPGPPVCPPADERVLVGMAGARAVNGYADARTCAVI